MYYNTQFKNFEINLNSQQSSSKIINIFVFCLYVKNIQLIRLIKNQFYMKSFILLLLIILIPFKILAYDFEVDGIYYKITSTTSLKVAITCKSTSFGGYSGDVTIPSIISYNGNNYTITSVDDYAFYNCTELNSISLPNTIDTIGTSAFYYCSSLTSLSLPTSVLLIKSPTFTYCTNLNSISIDNSNLNYTCIDGILFNKDKTNLIFFPPNKTDTTYSFTSTINKISTNAFTKCNNLKRITIPSTVLSIGLSVFSSCQRLKYISIESGITEICNYTFSDCDSLTSVVIPNTVTTIGKYAFNGCKLLKSIKIPTSVTCIGDYAFSYCSSLDSISIPNSVKSLGTNTFAFSTQICKFTCDNSNNYYSAAQGVLFNKEQNQLICYPPAKTDNSYCIPSTVDTIKTYAFYYCTNIQSLTIPISVVSIERRAFYNSKNLSSLYSYNCTPISLTSSNYIFYGVDTTNCILYVPAGSKSLYKTADVWKCFNNIVEMPTTDINTTLKTNETNISIYPNPTSTGFSISGIGEKQTKISVMDLNGKIYITKQINNDDFVDISYLSAGVYMVKVKDKTIKVIKQ
jgi:hypothetical protein